VYAAFWHAAVQVTSCHQTSCYVNPLFLKIARILGFVSWNVLYPDMCPPSAYILLSFTQPYETSLRNNAPKPFLACIEWRQVLRSHSFRHSVTPCAVRRSLRHSVTPCAVRHSLRHSVTPCAVRHSLQIHTARGNWWASWHIVWLRRIWFPDSLLSPYTASRTRRTSHCIHLCDCVIFFILESSLLFLTSYKATGQMRHKESFRSAGDTNCHSAPYATGAPYRN